MVSMKDCGRNSLQFVQASHYPCPWVALPILTLLLIMCFALVSGTIVDVIQADLNIAYTFRFVLFCCIWNFDT